MTACLAVARGRCVDFVNGACAPDSAWAKAAAGLEMGDDEDDGVACNVAAFAKLVDRKPKLRPVLHPDSHAATVLQSMQRGKSLRRELGGLDNLRRLTPAARWEQLAMLERICDRRKGISDGNCRAVPSLSPEVVK